MNISDITIKGDNREAILRELADKIPIVLESAGQTAEAYAKDNCPVDTGRLRNSITYGTSARNGNYTYKDDQGQTYNDTIGEVENTDHTVYIGTNVEYAPAQEYTDMNHRVGQAHFLRDSLQNHISEYKQILEAGLKN